MKRFIIDALFLLVPITVIAVSCTNEEGTVQALQDMGMTDIETTGYDAWSCGKDDGTCTGFRATNAQGRHVHGAVGCSTTGCGKGCTVRFK